jgi:hypothetical protein
LLTGGSNYLPPQKSNVKQLKDHIAPERQKESGLSIRSFCSNEGIAPSTFYFWQKKIRKEASGERFIPLLVRAQSSAEYPSAKMTDGPGQHDTPLEITYRKLFNEHIKIVSDN